AYDSLGRLLALGRVLPARRDGPLMRPPVDAVFESTGGARWARMYLTDTLGARLRASPGYATAQRLYSGQRLSIDGGVHWSSLPAAPGGQIPHVLSVGPISG